MRNEQKSELDEDIKHTSQQLMIKEKRKNQSESVQNYKLYDKIMDEISRLKATLREKTRDWKSIEWKVYQASWYQKRKSESSDRESETSKSNDKSAGGDSDGASLSSE